MTDTRWCSGLLLAANVASYASVSPRLEQLKSCLSDGGEVLLGLAKMTGRLSRVFVPLLAGGGTWKPKKSGTKTWVPTNRWIKRRPAGRMARSVRLLFFKLPPFKQTCDFCWRLQQGDLSSAGVVRTLHSLLKTQNTLQIQSITRSECTGRFSQHFGSFNKQS